MSHRPAAGETGVPGTTSGAVTMVLLARHGETPWHAENRYCGRTDVPLTPRGRHQARRLARWAVAAGVTAVVSSPLTRARDTAALAADAAGVPLCHDPRLVELDFGLAEGLTGAEIAARWPVERAAFERDPVANPLPGGEDPRAAIARGSAALDAIVDRHRGGLVLVVCHSTLLRLLTCHLTGTDPADYRRRFPTVANASGALLRHEAGSGRWSLLAFNPALDG